jgi:hypothetical protein
MNKYIEVLLVERAGYVARNLPHRVEQVDAALREVGYDHKYLTVETATSEPVAERATRPKVNKRKA